MKVLYRCEGEMSQTAEPRDLDDLLITLHQNHVPAVDLKDLVEALDQWGGYQGEHDFGRFVVVTAPDKDIFPCSKCGTPTHIDLLDAKDSGSGDFDILECKECYGPGWTPMRDVTHKDYQGERSDMPTKHTGITPRVNPNWSREAK